MDLTNDLYGWFASSDPNAKPIFDPAHDAPCPYCGRALELSDIRTHSLMAVEHPTRSYFYRTHRTCDDAANDGLKQSVFDGVLDKIQYDGEPVV